MKVSALVGLLMASATSAFTFHHSIPSTKTNPTFVHHLQQQQQRPTFLITSFSNKASATHLCAGGFEWEDPTENLDSGVENPFKNPDLLNKIGEDGEGMKIDPARLLGPRLQGSNLYFVGMMGSGKSAVGDIVARRMGTYNFLDTDTIIESVTNATINDIFAQEGEENFRDIESQVLDSVHAHVRCVVSTGGGIVNKLSNWAKLQSGVVIWIDVPPSILYERIKTNEDRPLLKNDDPLGTLEKLLEERKDRYAQADVRIAVEDGEMSAEDVADKVVQDLHNFIDENPPAWKIAKAKAQAEGLDWVQ
mmetsp:Transcript_19395/g.26617  ORF Transcript_19395/g.26617 Transcript_19395/m.26617 type:complete len:306 (-) Transcript_19395:287-1204(-)|eukprot:CAMPEP_0185729572 /NCGR_PEP_ID=MMETSP1171-20130828/6378_1 /TAXON_ID=374046 /ORGANISM="Helicotheca tamensis, Strain CCMP826" /LENGTH=305 /DNA_ID=CAMNT_0028398443 /DNA_START=112 /DNA_END=1029 /DNA_ORIENTATION=+